MTIREPRLGAILAAAALLFPACASSTPVAVALTRKSELPDPDHDVTGLRLGLLSSEYHRVAGLDVNGFWGCTRAPSGGLAVALGGNEASGSFAGLQLAGGVNFVQPLWSDEPRTISGAQIALLGNSGDLRGLQVGLWNGLPFTHDTRGDQIYGAQLGLMDHAGDLRGVQLGIVWSWAGDADGVQVAAWNTAMHLRGVQVGLLNVTKRGGVQLGLLNYNQHGFLKFFPIFNFGW